MQAICVKLSRKLLEAGESRGTGLGEPLEVIVDVCPKYVIKWKTIPLRITKLWQ